VVVWVGRATRPFCCWCIGVFAVSLHSPLGCGTFFNGRSAGPFARRWRRGRGAELLARGR
jgi:hypothetical protein